MNQDWQGALVRRLLLLLGGCLLLGLITGEYAWVLVIGLSGYLVWTLRQLLRLQRWLHRADPDEPPPDSAGIWGDVFDNLYQMQRRDCACAASCRASSTAPRARPQPSRMR